MHWVKVTYLILGTSEFLSLSKDEFNHALRSRWEKDCNKRFNFLRTCEHFTAWTDKQLQICADSSELKEYRNNSVSDFYTTVSARTSNSSRICSFSLLISKYTNVVNISLKVSPKYTKQFDYVVIMTGESVFENNCCTLCLTKPLFNWKNTKQVLHAWCYMHG